MTSVRVQDVTKNYALGRTTVLRGVSPSVEPGERVVGLADGRIAG